MIRRLLAAPILLCVALALAACGDAARFQTPIPTANPLKSARTVAPTPAAERAHERILSSYGGPPHPAKPATPHHHTGHRVGADTAPPPPTAHVGHPHS